MDLMCAHVSTASKVGLFVDHGTPGALTTHEGMAQLRKGRFQQGHCLTGNGGVPLTSWNPTVRSLTTAGQSQSQDHDSRVDEVYNAYATHLKG